MIKIRGLAYNPQKVSYSKTLGDEREVGEIIIKNSVKERYQKYDVVDIGQDYQYVIDVDQVRGLGNGLYEHTILLTGVIDYFEAIDVASRGIYPRANNIESIGTILNKYKRELEFYKNIQIDFIQGDWLNVMAIEDELDNLSFKKVLTRLFRILKATPKAIYDNGTWLIYPQKWSFRNNLVNINMNSYYQESDSVNYATKIKAQVKNAIYQDVEPSWFPSSNGYILPRGENISRTESELEYKLDSDIVSINKVIAVDVEFTTDDGNIVEEHIKNVDITEHVISEEEFDALEVGPLFDVSAGFIKAKQNHVRYAIQDSKIFGLYEQDQIGLFNTTIQYLNWAIRYQIGQMEEYDITEVKDILTDLRDTKLRIQYTKKRDLDILMNKHNSMGMNVSTEVYNQTASLVELSQLKSNLATLADRSGTTKETFTKEHDIGSVKYEVGDYTEDGRVITKAKYTENNNTILGEYNLNVNFASIEQEYQFKYQLNPYEITGKRLKTNPIQEQFMIASRESKSPQGVLNEKGRKSVLDILSANNNDANKAEYALYQSSPLNYQPNERIHMNVDGGRGSRSISLHASFRKNIVAGWENDEVDGNLIQQPIIYKKEIGGTFTLPDFKLYLAHDVDIEDSGRYPILEETQEMIDNALTIDETKPIDLGINDALGYTLMIHCMSDDQDIIVGNSFAEYNHLIRDVETTNLKLYKSNRPYTITDIEPRPNDTIDSGIFDFDISQRKLEVISDADYWAIVKELKGKEQILIAGNKVDEIYFNFHTTDKTASPIGFDITTLTPIPITQNYNINGGTIDAYISTFDLTAESITQNYNVSGNIEIQQTTLNLTAQTITQTYNVEGQITAELPPREWVLTSDTNNDVSNTYTVDELDPCPTSSYIKDWLTSQRDPNNHDIGTICRVVVEHPQTTCDDYYYIVEEK